MVWLFLNMNAHQNREGNDTPLQYSCPEKSHGWRSLVGCSSWGHEESDMTERLHFHFSLLCIREGNGNPLQCSCLENPRDGGPWWAAVYGVTRSRTLKQLSSSSSRLELIYKLISAISNIIKKKTHRDIHTYKWTEESFPNLVIKNGWSKILKGSVPLFVPFGFRNQIWSRSLQYSCLENPMDGGAWWAAVHGVARVGHD